MTRATLHSNWGCQTSSDINMDQTCIPCCALNRQITTVIIRTKMEVKDKLCRPKGCPNSACPKVVHRLSSCENCNRTRFNNQYSDCDSGLVGKCRTYKCRAARSRYVNVCAVVCLLLLVGGLSPRSSAAPHRSRTIDRQKRASEMENSEWRNPCGYDSDSRTPYTPQNAKFVAKQAKYSYDKAVKYKDEFASKLHSVSNFDAVLDLYKGDDWLRGYGWFQKEALPREVNAQEIRNLMGNIDDVLPSMYKGLKMVYASLRAFQQSLQSNNISTDANLVDNIGDTLKDVRNVLCNFYDLMMARNLKIEPLYDNEVPEITVANQLQKGSLIYRDTLDYLGYLQQVFQAMADLP